MSEPFIAEIRIFAGTFAPRGWAFCNGQLLPISQNTALYSLIGTVYGGDGWSTTALPNMQGRAPMHPGRGPGLTSRRLGEFGGTELVPLSEAQMPDHSHAMLGSSTRANLLEPTANSYMSLARGGPAYQSDVRDNLVPMAAATLESTGGSQPHNNMQPFLVMNFIIALAGVYPSRS